jgi:hypothetical protein
MENLLLAWEINNNTPENLLQYSKLLHLLTSREFPLNIPLFQACNFLKIKQVLFSQVFANS